MCGAGLYFLRSFKPALARDYDVFFAAIGLLCGGILFFQGWRLDPILQFGQFLLAGTTVFFAYESVRLRGIATDQARRSTYFDEEPSPPLRSPRGGLSSSWDDSYDQFEEAQPVRRRFAGRSNDIEDSEDDFYSPRRASKAAIPEEAASRRPINRQRRDSEDQLQDRQRRMDRFRNVESDISGERRADFGQRRNNRQDLRRGTRPSSNEQRSRNSGSNRDLSSSRKNIPNDKNQSRSQGSYLNSKSIEDAAFTSSRSTSPRNTRMSQTKSEKENNFNQRSSRQVNRKTSSSDSKYNQSPSKRRSMPRDNSSRFDD